MSNYSTVREKLGEPLIVISYVCTSIEEEKEKNRRNIYKQ